MLDTLIHKWLRVPYSLHVHKDRKPRKYARTIVLLHGIGNSGAAWDEIIDKLPQDIRIISLDLLGFGKSPRPEWAQYNVRTQARSVIATLLKLGLTSKVTLVGHSLGGLVSVEVAKRYPVLVKSLILCSPPFYDKSIQENKLVRSAFRSLRANPEQLVSLASVAMKYNLINKSFSLTDENVQSYIATLGASIINQTSLQDATELRKPMTILYGNLDPVLVKSNLMQVVDQNPEAKFKSFMAGHEMRGTYVDQVVKEIVASGTD